jgi:hypothetical protein
MIVSLGIAIWGLSLFWPEINRFLTEAVMIKVILGLGVITLVYVLHQHLSWPHDHHRTKQNDPHNPIPNNLTPSVSNEGG